MADHTNQPQQTAELTQQELTEQIRIRREKLAQLQSEGKDPFEQTKFDVTKHIFCLKKHFSRFFGKKML